MNLIPKRLKPLIRRLRPTWLRREEIDPTIRCRVTVKFVPNPISKVDPPLTRPTRFLVDSLFLCELIERLTFTSDEDVTYVTGIRIGNDRVLTRMIPIDLDSNSVAHAIANPASCAEALIRLVEADLPLVAMAHSHPGTSPESTRPSGVDLRYLDAIERNGAKVIGVIVNRGGCVRFFSAGTPFEIMVQGNEFSPVKNEKHVYQLAPK